MQETYRGPSAQQYAAHYGRTQTGRGGGGSGGQFGQIYSGARFQRGRGIGSFIGGIVRGISGLISRAPTWLKEGAKIAGKSALSGLADYGDQVRAGASKEQARKRAFRKAFGEALEEGGKRVQGGFGCRRRGVKRSRLTLKQTGSGKKKKCCRIRVLKPQSGGRRRKLGGKKKKRTVNGRGARKKTVRRPVKRIKRRAKFDLLSVV